VDASPGACELARKLVAANGLTSSVTVLCGRAETLELPVRRVDVLLCDWMGQAMLLHDSLLPAVIRMRDRWAPLRAEHRAGVGLDARTWHVRVCACAIPPSPPTHTRACT
jgi:hypothetical protein